MNSQQADFLLLVVVDEHAGRYEVLQLNRDTMTEIQRLGLGGGVVNTFTGQLALSHTYGSGDRDSCRNTVQAVSTLLYDVPIDHYVSVPMDAVPLLNDLVGGVRLRIEDDFSAVDPSLIRGTEVTLHGQQALTYVRARGQMEDPTNLSRMVRQRQYLRALGDKMREAAKADEDFALRAVLELSNGLVSDCTAQELAELANTLAEYPAAEVRTVDGESRVGERFMEFYPDDASIQTVVAELFYNETEI